MDAIPLLRSCRDDLPEPEEERLAAIRRRLETRMTAAGPEAVPRLGTPIGRRVAIGALAASVVGLVAVAAASIGPAPTASAEVGRLLDGAAAEAAGWGAATHGVRTVTIRSEGLSERIGAGGEVTAAYVARSVATLRIPDGRGEWVRTSHPLPARTFYGGAAGRALADEEGALRDLPHSAAAPLVERSADGDFTNGELGGGTVFGGSPAALRTLPTDPSRMLAVLREADLGAAPSASQAAHVLEAAAAVLTNGSATPDVQVAVFRALRLQPGLRVAGRVHDLDGRPGAVIGVERPSSPFDDQQLLLDLRTGRYLGARQVATADQGVLPAGTVVSASAVSEG